MLLHQLLMYKHTPPPRNLPESLVLSPRTIVKLSRLTSALSMDSSSHVTDRAMTQISLRALSRRYLACSRSILVWSERMVDRMIEGRGGLNGRLGILQWTPPRLPLFLDWSSGGRGTSGLMLVLDRLIFCRADDLRVRLLKSFRGRMLIISFVCKFRIQVHRALGRVLVLPASMMREHKV